MLNVRSKQYFYFKSVNLSFHSPFEGTVYLVPSLLFCNSCTTKNQNNLTSSDFAIQNLHVNKTENNIQTLTHALWVFETGSISTDHKFLQKRDKHLKILYFLSVSEQPQQQNKFTSLQSNLQDSERKECHVPFGISVKNYF